VDFDVCGGVNKIFFMAFFLAAAQQTGTKTACTPPAVKGRDLGKWAADISNSPYTLQLLT
jgi:hypothetical protein